MANPELDKIYVRILTTGLIAVRNAADAGDLARCRAESHHLHNLPSLIGEPNEKRHLFYFASEKTAYLKWVLESGRKEVKEFVALHYLPQWKRIGEILHVDEILGEGERNGNVAC